MFPFGWIVFILCLLIARALSTYKECGYFKSYITIENKVLGRLLTGKPKIKKEKPFDGYRIRYVGLIFYCWSIVAFLVAIFVLLLPEVKGTVINFGRIPIITDSVNVQYCVYSFISLLFTAGLVEMFELDSLRASKPFKTLDIALIIVSFLLLMFSFYDLITILKAI